MAAVHATVTQRFSFVPVMPKYGFFLRGDPMVVPSSTLVRWKQRVDVSYTYRYTSSESQA